MAANKNNQSIVVASTRAVTTPSEPEVFEQLADNTPTGAVELRPEGTTVGNWGGDTISVSGAFTVSYEDPGPIVVPNSWRGDVEAKVIVPPAEETPIFAATEAETKETEGGATDTASEPA